MREGDAVHPSFEGVKPEGTPNSLVAAQPMVCKDIDDKSVNAPITFVAPSEAGTYTIRAHIQSTSVIGVDLSASVDFQVVEDDCPDVEGS